MDTHIAREILIEQAKRLIDAHPNECTLEVLKSDSNAPHVQLMRDYALALGSWFDQGDERLGAFWFDFKSESEYTIRFQRHVVAQDAKWGEVFSWAVKNAHADEGARLVFDAISGEQRLPVLAALAPGGSQVYSRDR